MKLGQNQRNSNNILTYLDSESVCVHATLSLSFEKNKISKIIISFTFNQIYSSTVPNKNCTGPWEKDQKF